MKENSESSGTFYFVETKISKLIIIWYTHVSKLPRSYGKRRISALKGRKINQAPRMDYIPCQEFLAVGDVENLVNIFPQKIVECIQEKIKF